MKNPHSHPAHRNVPDKDMADNPNMTDAAKARSDQWLRELDESDPTAKYQAYVGKIFVGTD